MTRISLFTQRSAKLMSCTLFAFCSLIGSALHAQSFNTLTNFNGINGSSPYANLVQGIDGSFYGTTRDGGTNNGGVVFKITPKGVLKIIYNFCARGVCADGSAPSAALTLGLDGNFYGVTGAGGTNGGGTVFKITPTGTLTTLYSFCNQCSDSSAPIAAITLGRDGNFFGTTANGGDQNFGTIYKITPTGKYTLLHIFTGADGEVPSSSLVQASDGKFYGTAQNGGSEICFFGCGTIFRVTSQGNFTTLYTFCGQYNCPDGAFPFAGLVQGLDGRLYGTTAGGGTHNDWGTVFKVTTTGNLIDLYDFCGQSNCTDGAEPEAEVIQANDGKFYGTTNVGGVNQGYGSIFKISSHGYLQTIHSFDNTDGAYPAASLFQATSGKFYGTTTQGGSSGDGTVFSLDMGLGPFVAFVRASGRVGQAAGILGQNFTGATSVSLNGTPMNFTVVSDTLIKTTVPSGATTGYVTVTAPSGVLTSNVPFQVIP